MISRDEIKNFLIGQKGKTKEEVLMNFTSYALAQGVAVDKLGKIIMDLRSYPDWTWSD